MSEEEKESIEEEAKKAAEEEKAKKAAEEEEKAKKTAEKEEKAKKTAEEEEKAKKIAEKEEKAKKAAEEERKSGFLLEGTKILTGTTELLFKVLQTIDFKGEGSSIPSLRVALMLDEKVFIEGLKTGVRLEFLKNNEENLFEITEEGSKLLNLSDIDKKQFIASKMLGIEQYSSIIFRIKSQRDKPLPMNEIEKAFYIILSNLREEIRKDAVKSFVDFALYANLVELSRNKDNPGLHITSNGEKQFNKFMELKKQKSGKKPGAAAVKTQMDLNCGSCGKPIMSDYKLCPYCGTALQRNCSSCGKELQPGWKMCPFCGTTQ